MMSICRLRGSESCYPLLRMLYHPRGVVFIVAADREHMVFMMELNFVGQQNRLANRQPVGEPPRAPRFDRWPDTLAKASFQKVFPPRNIWKLSWLTLRELLDFPPSGTIRLKDVLNTWEPSDKSKATSSQTGLGDYFYLAGTIRRDWITENGGDKTELPEDSIELPQIISFRTAQQIGQQILRQPLAKETALLAIGQIMRGADSDDVVRITKRLKQGDPGPARGILSCWGVGCSLL